MKAWLAVLMLAVLVMGLLPTLPASPTAAQQQGHWDISCVDCPKMFGELTDHSLRLDAEGHPHIAYGGDHLYYAYHNGSTWHYETADESPGVGSSAALDLDPAGRPYIAYYDSLNQDLKLAFRDGAGWHVTTVDTGGFPHVSATVWVGSEPGWPEWQYKYRDNAGWHTVNQDGLITIGQTSVALDASGHPFLGYPTWEGLSLATFDGVNWQTGSVDASDDVGRFSSMALDSAGRPVVGYSAKSAGMKVASWNGASWTIDDLSMLRRAGRVTGVSLALDSDDRLMWPTLGTTTRTGTRPNTI